MNKKKIGIIGLLVIVLISGCYGPKTATQPTTTSSAGGGGQSTGEVKEFTMTAKQWEFIPGTITVNKGDTVKLTITSTDVAHGFNLPEFEVSERLDVGTPVEVEFVADKTGTFTFSCSVPCGSGHGGMKGTLIVE